MTKHFHDLMRHGERSVIASMSARLDSISDNRLGGWYANRTAIRLLAVIARLEPEDTGRIFDRAGQPIAP